MGGNTYASAKEAIKPAIISYTYLAEVMYKAIGKAMSKLEAKLMATDLMSVPAVIRGRSGEKEGI
jgi:hypothetical protein